MDGRTPVVAVSLTNECCKLRILCKLNCTHVDVLEAKIHCYHNNDHYTLATEQRHYAELLNVLLK